MRSYFMVRVRENVEEFVNNGIVAIGWSKVDLSRNIDFDELWKEVEKEHYTNDSSNRTKGRAKGEISRFKSIKTGDLVVVPAYKGFYLGEAVRFDYDKSLEKKDLSNLLILNYRKDIQGKPVKFIRDDKNTGLSTKLGSRYTVLAIKEENIIKEIDGLFKSGQSSLSKIILAEQQNEDEFRIALSKAIPDYNGIFLKSKGRGFEELIAEMMRQDGFEAYVLSKKVGGSGIADADVLAIKKSVLGDQFNTVYCIQAKHFTGESEAGIEQIIEFKKMLNQKAKEIDFDDPLIPIALEDGGTISIKPDMIKFVLISSGSFKDDVEEIAADNDIILIDGNTLADMLYRVIDGMPKMRQNRGFVKSYKRYESQIE